jgi:hypothetical protein
MSSGGSPTAAIWRVDSIQRQIHNGGPTPMKWSWSRPRRDSWSRPRRAVIHPGAPVPPPAPAKEATKPIWEMLCGIAPRTSTYRAGRRLSSFPKQHNAEAVSWEVSGAPNRQTRPISSSDSSIGADIPEEDADVQIHPAGAAWEHYVAAAAPIGQDDEVAVAAAAAAVARERTAAVSARRQITPGHAEMAFSRPHVEEDVSYDTVSESVSATLNDYVVTPMNDYVLTPIDELLVKPFVNVASSMVRLFSFESARRPKQPPVSRPTSDQVWIHYG